MTDCHITCPNPNRNSTFVNRSLIPNKLRYYLLFLLFVSKIKWVSKCNFDGLTQLHNNLSITICSKFCEPLSFRCPTEMDGGGFVANNEFDADTKIPSYLRDVLDSNIEQIVQKNSIFNIYLTIVEIFYFCIIAQENILKLRLDRFNFISL